MPGFAQLPGECSRRKIKDQKYQRKARYLSQILNVPARENLFSLSLQSSKQYSKFHSKVGYRISERYKFGSFRTAASSPRMLGLFQVGDKSFQLAVFFARLT